MRTSEEIYHRVRWDPRFDAARFVLGIDLRGRPPKRVPLSAFQPGGDIPWHRVLFVEADGVLVWDRASGVDRIDSAGAGLARRPLRLRPPFFAARTARRWDPVEGWGAGGAGQATTNTGTRQRVRILTWNTLWDRYDADRIHTRRRRPLLLAELARADADVIALQEVDAELLRMLLAEAWVRADYTVTVDPGGRDVDDAGLLLLSRLPVLEAGWRELGRHKAAAAIVVGGCGEPLTVVNTHLSSDHSTDGAGRRAAELATLREALTGVGCSGGGGAPDGHADTDTDADDGPATAAADGRGVIVVGDFNDGSDGAKGPAARLGLTDAWTAVRGAGDRTPTFDPRANPLAAVSSLSGRAARLDRVLVRGGGLRAIGAELRGAAPDASGLYVSDHYGVQVDVEVGDAGPAARPAEEAAEFGVLDALDVPATARTALAWIPPRELWPALQAVRERHDPRFDRWPPHVNVLFGFVPEVEFERAAEIVAAAVRSVPPFEVVLAGVRTFERKGDEATVWLDPASEPGEAGEPAGAKAEWSRLRAAVERGFPGCRARHEGFTPHLTLGRVRGAAAAAGIRMPAMRSEVAELTLLSRRGTEPMRARAVVALGSGEVRWLDEDEDRRSPASATELSHHLPVSATPDTLAERVTAAVAAALPEATVHVVGSRGMGCALPDADLDLVAALPHVAVGGVRDVGEHIAAGLLKAPDLPKATNVREVVGARVPGLRFRVGALDVDLILVDPTVLEADGEPSAAQAVAFSAVTDAAAVLASVGGRRDAFADLARQVKAWARARGLDSAPFGGVPGIAWSVLVADSVRADPDAGLARFFGEQAARDWRQPIWTPTPPRRDLIAQVGPGFRELIAEELYRAWELAEGGRAAAELLAPPPMHRRHAAWAVVTVRGDTEAGFADVLGRTRGRLRSLLATLEDAGLADVHAWPWAFETSATSARYAIGMGRTPVDADRLRALSRPWLRGLAGVTVQYAAGGEVPTLGISAYQGTVRPR